MKPELLHCPFCAGEAELSVTEEERGYSAFVWCLVCDCQTAKFSDVRDGEAMRRAAHAWNERKTPFTGDE